MSQKIIKRDEFFNIYFKKNAVNENTKKELNNILSLKHEEKPNNKYVHVISENTISLVLNLPLKLPLNIFKINFRETLIEYLKKKYENRAYYLFYIESFDYTNILTSELPLIKKIDNFFYLNLPIQTKLIIFKRDDIVLMNLVLITDNVENKVQIYATNKYFSCKINLSIHQIIETNYSSNEAILHDKKTETIYKNNSQIAIKLIDFYNNQLEDGFTAKINCMGEIVYL